MKLFELKNENKAREILVSILAHIYKKGPVCSQDLEVLSYISIFHPQIMSEYIDDIILYLGAFYKAVETTNSLQGYALHLFKEVIHDRCHDNFTPVQASILLNGLNNQIFSFSAPTSTGKSHVLFSFIEQSPCDVVVIVPSRALINEYYIRLCEEIPDKTVNILTYVDKINTQKCKKNIFVLTPERCKDLFRLKNQFNVGIILFDEAQLTDEKGKRGLFFDSIVRRCSRELPDAKMLFAHPFIENPEAQIDKNRLSKEKSSYKHYTQKNVGQIFVCEKEEGTFSYFGSDSEILGTKQVKCLKDPIEECINKGGTVLFYVSKNSLINNSYLNSFQKYIDLCQELNDPNIQAYIDELRDLTGGDTIAYMNYYSQMLALLKRGIVIHHGSLPLHARVLVEKFTRAGYCKICFATSTLEQGINMPFDIVYIDRLEASKSLSVKNLIGRAGRSTMARKLDYGMVIVASSKVPKLRKILKDKVEISSVSQFDVQDDNLDDEYKEFKDAIVHNTFSDQFNLTQKKVETLSNKNLDALLKNILDIFFETFHDGIFELDSNDKENIISSFTQLYEKYLGRSLAYGEVCVIRTAISIMIMKIQGKTFSNICRQRYSYVSKMKTRRKIERIGNSTEKISASFTQRYKDLPNSDLNYPISLFPQGTKAKDVDYDIITYDTYDYLDKLLNLYLSDIFYAAFYKYNERNSDDRAIKMANLIKYGTFTEKYIWMLRYGISFENIDILDPYIKSINEEGVTVYDQFYELPQKQRECIARYID